MDGQINLFGQLEQEDRDRKNRDAVRAGYRKWLQAPALTPCGPDAVIDYGAYNGIIHMCQGMPDGVYMWQNTVCGIHGGQFWCRQEPDVSAEGRQMDVCPYCGADLCHGEGARYLRKTDGYVYGQRYYRSYYGLDEIDTELEARCEV